MALASLRGLLTPTITSLKLLNHTMTFSLIQKDLESLESQQVKQLLTNQEKYFVELINHKKELQTLNQIVALKV